VKTKAPIQVKLRSDCSWSNGSVVLALFAPKQTKRDEARTTGLSHLLDPQKPFLNACGTVIA
jgi:hypothetical protein